MSELSDTQKRALDQLKKAIEAHKAKPTNLTKDLVMHHYNKSLRHTLSAEHLTKEEKTILQGVANS